MYESSALSNYTDRVRGVGITLALEGGAGVNKNRGAGAGGNGGGGNARVGEHRVGKQIGSWQFPKFDEPLTNRFRHTFNLDDKALG